jgi:predicted  nucleic acid-binding Zn-ribbon protein
LSRNKGKYGPNIKDKEGVKMFHKISINNYGSLIGFSNDQNQFTNSNAIIHGMNGSGKSQICTILHQIEQLKKNKILGPDTIKEEEKKILKLINSRISKESTSRIIDVQVDNYSVSFDLEKNKITENGVAPDMFVFNDDYVNETIGDFIKIHDQEIRIGQKNVLRDNLVRERQDKEKALRKVIEEIDKIVAESRVGSAYEGQARTERIISKENYLGKTNSGESHPDAKLQLSKLSNPPDLITSHHKYLFPSLTIDEKNKHFIDEITTRPYLEPKLNQEVYKSYLVVKKNFYEEGVSLFSQTKPVCPFCLTPKNENDQIIQELINYINSDYNENVKRLQSIIDLLYQGKNDLKTFISDWNSLLSIINEKARALSMNKQIVKIISNENYIDNCINLLKNKIDNMSETIAISDLDVFKSYEDYVKSVQDDYHEHKKFIDEINNKIEQISGLKRSLGEKIIKNQMYLLWENNALRDRYEELNKEIADIKTKIAEVSTVLSNNKIPDFFNQIIKILGISKYELSRESLLILKLENDFDISNEGYRISAGERKIIAFCYFLSEVLASAGSSADLMQKTIIIDDPVDSSDYDKFYSFISVIENFDNILIGIFKNNEIKFGQILIFTHSALLYERFINSNKLCYFLLQMDNNKTTIVKPKRKISLTTFSSYIKKITNYIKRMNCSNTKDIGNYIRRVLEIICSVENIDTNEIKNINSSSKLNALANHLSHESIERILDPLPITWEYIEACIELIEEIKQRMPYLYRSIVEKYFDNNEIEYYRKEYEKNFLLK